MKAITLVLFSFIIINGTHAQTILKDVDDVTKHAESIMAQLKKKDIEKSYDLLNKYWLTPDEYRYETELLEVDEFDTNTKGFGKVIGAELIEKKQVKDVLIRMKYLLRFENGAIYIKIGYYKNEFGWIVNEFDTTDNMDGLYR